MSIKLSVLQLKSGCFVSMQIVRKVLTSTLHHLQPVSSAARNNYTLISLTVSYNEINLRGVLMVT